MTNPSKSKKPASSTSETPEKISKTQLIDLVAEKSGLSKKDAGAVVAATLEVIVEALQSGKSVGLPSLGTLSVKPTAARTGVKPGTDQKIQIPAGKKVGFKVATDLKASL